MLQLLQLCMEKYNLVICTCKCKLSSGAVNNEASMMSKILTADSAYGLSCFHFQLLKHISLSGRFYSS